MAYDYDPAAREPWNNIIYPGNYVARLNAYRNQGVTAFPGVNCFRLVGVFNPQDSDFTIDAVTGVKTLPAGSYTCEILSPDLRQDDKPRLDRAFEIPAGASVYRTAIQSDNLSAAANGDTIKTNPVSVGGKSATLTSAGTVFPPSGDWTPFEGFDSIVPLGAVATVGVTTDGDFTVTKNGDNVAIIVEVCFFMDDEAPDVDEINLPYKTETGQSTN